MISLVIVGCSGMGEERALRTGESKRAEDEGDDALSMCGIDLDLAGFLKRKLSDDAELRGWTGVPGLSRCGVLGEEEELFLRMLVRDGSFFLGCTNGRSKDGVDVDSSLVGDVLDLREGVADAGLLSVLANGSPTDCNACQLKVLVSMVLGSGSGGDPGVSIFPASPAVSSSGLTFFNMVSIFFLTKPGIGPRFSNLLIICCVFLQALDSPNSS